MTRNFIIIVAVFALITSCQSVDISELIDEKEEGYELTFNIGKYTITDFPDVQTNANEAKATRTKKAASELGTVVNFAIFNNGERIKAINQKSGDNDFGTVKVNLPEGTYQLVALVHNCSGNATLTSTDKITFPSNKVTDTFSYFTDIEVTKSESVDISLDRVVSKFRFTVADEIPADVAQMQFYYTGGSSTLNAETGFGCVSSRQTEVRDVKDHSAGQVFEVYTFPHDTTDELSMTVSALDSKGNVYAVKTLEAVPVEYQKVTNSSMTFFGSGASTSADAAYSLYGDDEWKGEIEY